MAQHWTQLQMGDGAGVSSLTGVTPPFSCTLDPMGNGSEPPPAGVWVLDRLTLEWSTESYPQQPEPQVATWRLLCEDPEALPPLEIGTPVWFQSWAVPGPGEGGGWGYDYYVHLATFYGRVSDAVARAVTFQGRAMLEVEVTATDTYAEWREIIVGAQPFPQESSSNRLDRVGALANLVQTFSWDGGAGLVTFRALDVDSRPWLDLMDEHLAQIADIEAGSFFQDNDERGFRRGIVVPILSDGSLDVDGPPGGMDWTAQPLYGRGGTGPRVFVEVDGLLTTMAATTGDGRGAAIVSAAYCAAALEWRRDKAAAPNRVLVSGEFMSTADPAVTVTTAEAVHEDLVATKGPVTKRLDATLLHEAAAKDMAAMYLPDRGEYVGRWAAEKVTVYLAAIGTAAEATALLENPGLFPWHGTDQSFKSNLGTLPYGTTFHVHGLQAGHRLGGLSYVAGTVLGARLEVHATGPVDQRLLLEVTLSPQVRRPAYDPDPANSTDEQYAPATPNTLKWHHPTVTVRDAGAGAPHVDPTVTVYDLRLVRNEEGTL